MEGGLLYPRPVPSSPDACPFPPVPLLTLLPPSHSSSAAAPPHSQNNLLTVGDEGTNCEGSRHRRRGRALLDSASAACGE